MVIFRKKIGYWILVSNFFVRKRLSPLKIDRRKVVFDGIVLQFVCS